MTSGSTFFMDNETKEKYELQDDLDKIYNVVRMVILKNLETGEIYNFIMVFIGTYDYLNCIHSHFPKTLKTILIYIVELILMEKFYSTISIMDW